jgi:hypothetical protein
LYSLDRLFWIGLRRLWVDWAEALIIVKPDTVVAWHRAGLRLFWMAVAVSAPRPTHGRRDPPVDSTYESPRIRAGVHRIHGELLQLGVEISEPTVSRYLRRLKRHGDDVTAKRWLAFLNNHAK